MALCTWVFTWNWMRLRADGPARRAWIARYRQTVRGPAPVMARSEGLYDADYYLAGQPAFLFDRAAWSTDGDEA